MIWRTQTKMEPAQESCEQLEAQSRRIKTSKEALPTLMPWMRATKSKRLNFRLMADMASFRSRRGLSTRILKRIKK